MHAAVFLLLFSFSLPPAIKVLAVAGIVYGILQALKQPNKLTPYIKGWVAVALNVALSIFGVVVATPADQLYTMATLETIIMTILAAAGIHGTITLAPQAAKKTAIILACILLPGLALSGCKPATNSTAPAAVAPGYQNATDQQLGEIIAGATGFYNRVQADIQAGKYQATSTEVTALNSFALTLNTAKIVYGQYHAGTATLAQAQAAVSQVQQQQTALQSTLTGGK